MAVKDIFAEGGKLPDPIDTQREKPKEQTLDELLEEFNKGDISEAKRTQLRVRITEMQLREAQMQAEIRDLRAREVQPGNGKTEAAAKDKVGDEKEKAKQDIAANALLLIQKGVSPDIVARYILSASDSKSNVAITGAGGGFDMAGFSQLVNTIKDLVKPNGGGGDPEMKETLKALQTSIQAMADKKSDEQIQSIKELVNEVKALKSGEGVKVKVTEEKTHIKTRIYVPDKGRWIPQEFEPGETVVLPPIPAAETPGKSVEEIKEEHRHDERLAEIGIDKVNKEETRKILADVGASVVDTGTAIAAEIFGKGAAGAVKPAAQSNIEHYKCSRCGTDIPYKVGALTITCPNPKCVDETGRRTSYTDQSQVPEGTKKEPATAQPAQESADIKTEETGNA